jgi:Flp pilus assembly protein TadG
MRTRHSRCHDRRGATLVEFAVVAPLFFMLVMAIIEFTRAMSASAALANAAHAAARVAILDSAQLSDVTAASNGCLSTAGLPPVTPTISPNPPSNAAAGQDVTVTVSLPFSQISWLPLPQWLGGVTLSATAIEQRETSR